MRIIERWKTLLNILRTPNITLEPREPEYDPQSLLTELRTSKGSKDRDDILAKLDTNGLEGIRSFMTDSSKNPWPYTLDMHHEEWRDYLIYCKPLDTLTSGQLQNTLTHIATAGPAFCRDLLPTSLLPNLEVLYFHTILSRAETLDWIKYLRERPDPNMLHVMARSIIRNRLLNALTREEENKLFHIFPAFFSLRMCAYDEEILNALTKKRKWLSCPQAEAITDEAYYCLAHFLGSGFKIRENRGFGPAAPFPEFFLELLSPFIEHPRDIINLTSPARRGQLIKHFELDLHTYRVPESGKPSAPTETRI
jgi:hypothetical protein